MSKQINILWQEKPLHNLRLNFQIVLVITDHKKSFATNIAGFSIVGTITIAQRTVFLYRNIDVHLIAGTIHYNENRNPWSIITRTTKSDLDPVRNAFLSLKFTVRLLLQSGFWESCEDTLLPSAGNNQQTSNTRTG